MAHVLQGLCELDDHCTVTSIDGISAYDLVSRAAMLDGLLNRVGGEALPFVRMFYGSPSSYMWEEADTPSGKAKEGSTPKQCKTTCVREISSSHIWTISTLSPVRSEWGQCMRLFTEVG